MASSSPKTPEELVKSLAAFAMELSKIGALKRLADWASGNRRIARATLTKLADQVAGLGWSKRPPVPDGVLPTDPDSADLFPIAHKAVSGDQDAREALITAVDRVAPLLREMNLPRRWANLGIAFFLRQLLLAEQAERRAIAAGMHVTPFFAPLLASPDKLAALAGGLGLDAYEPRTRASAERWRQRCDRERLRVAASSAVLHKQNLSKEARALIESGRYLVRKEYRRCRRGGCATCKRGKGHGPYLYLTWRLGGAVKRYYLGSVDRMLR